MSYYQEIKIVLKTGLAEDGDEVTLSVFDTCVHISETDEDGSRNPMAITT